LGHDPFDVGCFIDVVVPTLTDLRKGLDANGQTQALFAIRDAWRSLIRWTFLCHAAWVSLARAMFTTNSDGFDYRTGTDVSFTLVLAAFRTTKHPRIDFGLTVGQERVFDGRSQARSAFPTPKWLTA
jgi:hypothetical protein